MMTGRKGDVLRARVWLDHDKLAATPFPRAMLMVAMRYVRRQLAEADEGNLEPPRCRVAVDGQRTRITLEATFK